MLIPFFSGRDVTHPHTQNIWSLLMVHLVCMQKCSVCPGDATVVLVLSQMFHMIFDSTCISLANFCGESCFSNTAVVPILVFWVLIVDLRSIYQVLKNFISPSWNIAMIVLIAVGSYSLASGFIILTIDAVSSCLLQKRWGFGVLSAASVLSHSLKN